MRSNTWKRQVLIHFVGLTTIAGVAYAHEGHAHKVMGTITAISATQIEVESKSDGTASKTTLAIDAETRFLAGKEAAQASDAKVGSRVVVTYMEHGAQKLAHEILLPAKSAVPDEDHAHDHPAPGGKDASELSCARSRSAGWGMQAGRGPWNAVCSSF